MNRKYSFDDALNAAIEALHAGQPLASVLAAHHQYATMLRPLLETATEIKGDARQAPEPTRLQGNYSLVSAALRDARRSSEGTSRTSGASWWQRRIVFASVSLPAVAVAAIAIAGAGGAAAATLAVTQPSMLGRAADALTPDWAQNALPSLPNHDGGNSNAPPALGTPNDTGTAAPSPSSTAANAGSVTLTGIISDLHGANFTLTSGDVSSHVVTSNETSITGVVTDGAAATVSGRTSGGTLHADAIAVDGVNNDPEHQDNTATPSNAPGNSGDPPGQSGTPPGNSGDPPGQSGTPPGNSGNAPGHSGTPPGNSGNPPGQSGTPPGNSGNPPGQNKTPEPGAEPPGQDKTPPGQSGSAPGQNKTPGAQGNGNGNGGGPKKP